MGLGKNPRYRRVIDEERRALDAHIAEIQAERLTTGHIGGLDLRRRERSARRVPKAWARQRLSKHEAAPEVTLRGRLVASRVQVASKIAPPSYRITTCGSSIPVPVKATVPVGL